MPQKNSSADKLTVRHFWHAGTEFRRDFYLSLFIPLAAFCLYTLAPFMVGKILGSLARPQSDIVPYIIGFVAVSIIGVLSNGIGFTALLRWQPKVMARLQSECLSMLLHRGTAFHNNQVSGKLVSDAIDYPSAYSQLSTALFTNIIPFAVTVVTGLTIIAASSPLLGLLMLVMSSLAIGSGIAQRRRMAPLRARRILATKAVTSHLADTIVNIHAVKTFAQEERELKEHGTLNHALMLRRMHDWRMVAIDGTSRIAGLLVFELLFILLTVWLVHRNPALLSTGIFAFSYTITLTNRLFEIGTMLRSTEDALQLAEPITIAMQQSDEVLNVPNAPALKAVAGGITFKAVNFHYSDSSAESAVFKALDMIIKPGEKVGLVGPSGGGKSTITKLLLRYEDIQSGSIQIDGQDISLVTQQSLRAAIAYVPQESLLFHRSIKHNISYGNLDASNEAVVKAAKDAYAHDFIMSLPDGYDTVVGERGVKLSGGQRQRVAIARAMLKNAPIIVLDEATSALDSESEKVIQDALYELMQNRTSLVIAHRLSTIQRMDRIIVLDNGQIIETGSHLDLLAKKGLYAKLWARQSGGFIED